MRGDLYIWSGACVDVVVVSLTPMKRVVGFKSGFSADGGARNADMSPNHLSLTSSGMPSAPLDRNNSSTSREGPDMTVESETLRRVRSNMPPRTRTGWASEGSEELKVPIVKSSPFREPLR
jgi:hypothetical protein